MHYLVLLCNRTRKYSDLTYDFFFLLFSGMECELLYLFCSDLIYDFLMTLGKRLTEVDASSISTVLDCKFYFITLSWSD